MLIKMFSNDNGGDQACEGGYDHNYDDDDFDDNDDDSIAGSPTTCVAVSRSLNTSSGRMW